MIAFSPCLVRDVGARLDLDSERLHLSGENLGQLERGSHTETIVLDNHLQRRHEVFLGNAELPGAILILMDLRSSGDRYANQGDVHPGMTEDIENSSTDAGVVDHKNRFVWPRADLRDRRFDRRGHQDIVGLEGKPHQVGDVQARLHLRFDHRNHDRGFEVALHELAIASLDELARRLEHAFDQRECRVVLRLPEVEP